MSALSQKEVIRYRDWEISPNSVSYFGSTDWVGVHKDYDPTPNYPDDFPADDRCVYGISVAAVMDQIDMWYDDNEEPQIILDLPPEPNIAFGYIVILVAFSAGFLVSALVF